MKARNPVNKTKARKAVRTISQLTSKISHKTKITSLFQLLKRSETSGRRMSHTFLLRVREKNSLKRDEPTPRLQNPRRY